MAKDRANAAMSGQEHSLNSNARVGSAASTLRGQGGIRPSSNAESEANTGICTVGWVNLYQKFEIEKYTVCGKLILPKKWKEIFFGTTGMRICMDLRIFASFLYPTILKICTQKFERK